MNELKASKEQEKEDLLTPRHCHCLLLVDSTLLPGWTWKSPRGGGGGTDTGRRWTRVVLRRRLWSFIVVFQACCQMLTTCRGSCKVATAGCRRQGRCALLPSSTVPSQEGQTPHVVSRRCAHIGNPRTRGRSALKKPSCAWPEHAGTSAAVPAHPMRCHRTTRDKGGGTARRGRGGTAAALAHPRLGYINPTCLHRSWAGLVLAMGRERGSAVPPQRKRDEGQPEDRGRGRTGDKREERSFWKDKGG